MPYVVKKDGKYLGRSSYYSNSWVNLLNDARIYRIEGHAISGYKNRGFKNCDIIEVEIKEVIKDD